MKLFLSITGAIAFAFIARWAQKRFSKYEVTMKNADGTVESHTEGKYP